MKRSREDRRCQNPYQVLGARQYRLCVYECRAERVVVGKAACAFASDRGPTLHSLAGHEGLEVLTLGGRVHVTASIIVRQQLFVGTYACKVYYVQKALSISKIKEEMRPNTRHRISTARL